MSDMPAPAPAPAAQQPYESKLQELRQGAQQLQARLGYVQIQIDALTAEKESLVATLRRGEEAFAAISALFPAPPAQPAQLADAEVHNG